MNYYISDTHYFHKNIVGRGKNFDHRPYETLEEMHEDMKNKWNNVVSNADHVYILGDFTWKVTDEALEFLKSLNGNHHLITGNHDYENGKFKKLFVETIPYKETKDIVDGKEYKLVLSHYPIYSWNGMHRNTIHLYGHVHNSTEDKMYQKALLELNQHYKNRDGEKYVPFYAYNVGCMHWNYTPVTLEQILDSAQII